MSNRDIKLILSDALASIIALYVGFLLRFEFIIPSNFIDVLIGWAPVFTLIQVVTFYISGLYARIWRYTSLFDLYAILSAVVSHQHFLLFISYLQWVLLDTLDRYYYYILYLIQ